MSKFPAAVFHKSSTEDQNPVGLDFLNRVKHPWRTHSHQAKQLSLNVSVSCTPDITLSTKVHIVKAMDFPVVMYECEGWTVKKAEWQRIDALKLWCWRRHLIVPWKARRSNQSILKDINPEYSLEELMLKLKLQYFGHLMWRADSLEKTLMLGKIEMAGWHHQLNGHESEQTPGDSEGQGTWHAAVHGVTKSRTWLSNWTELNLAYVGLCVLLTC